jgi:hypothetical protein
VAGRLVEVEVTTSRRACVMLIPMRRSLWTRNRRRLGLAGTLVGTGVALAAPASAEAAVRGREGIEIAGAQDRRGFYIGGGLGFGGTFFAATDFFPAMRLDLALGGGVTKNFTLGANLHVTPYLQRGIGVAFGGDIEGTGYIWKGLYLRGALGASGVPKRDVTRADDDRGLTVGLGGAVGFGYEFFLNATAAMGVGLTYDVRYIPGDRFPRQTALVGARFLWY